MALSQLTAAAIKKALEEFDQLGRNGFLKKYGFGRARDYFLLQRGHAYDSKAIAGAAHGYLPREQPLNNDDFSGGEDTVAKTLRNLGFVVTEPNESILPKPGEVLTNEDIVVRFAVGNMGGMRLSAKNRRLVLISDPFKGLYQDRWEGNVLHYTGMGPAGDQSLDYAQNRTLARSAQDGTTVHLLEALSVQQYTYAGEVRLIAPPNQEEQIGQDGRPRKVWMFPIQVVEGGIVPQLSATEAKALEEHHARMLRRLPLDERERRALAAKKNPESRTAQSIVFGRDESVSELAKEMAKGRCDLCEERAPFLNSERLPYLETHHVIWLARGGEDTIANTVALCPNCHRKMHVRNEREDVAKLTKLAAERAAEVSARHGKKIAKI